MRPVTGAAGHQQVAGPAGGLDRPLGSAQDEVGAVDPDLQSEVVEAVVGSGLEVAPRGDRGAGQQPGQQVGVAIGRQVAEGTGDEVGGDQWAGGGVAPELVGHQGEVAETVAADRTATVLLGDEQGGPPEFGAPSASSRRRSRRGRRGGGGSRPGGTCSVRNFAVVSRKNSWSEVRLSCMAGPDCLSSRA